MESDNGEKWPNKPQEILSKILKTGLGSDIEFVFECMHTHSMNKIKAHSIIFMSASPYFYDLLKNKELSRNKPIDLKITDVTFKTFQILMTYLYTGDYDASMSDAVEVYVAAKQFDFAHLGLKCKRLFKNGLNLDNVLSLFKKIIECNVSENELAKPALTYICRNAREVIKTNEFCNLPEDCLLEILKQTDLEVRDEIELLNSVLRWGKAECVRKELDESNSEVLRRVLQKAFTFIRFPNLDKIDFAKEVAEKGLLIGKDLSTMLLYFFSKIEKRSPLPSVRFNSVKRKYAGVKHNNSKTKKTKLDVPGAVTYRFSRENDEAGYEYSSFDTKENVEVLMFTANECLYLVGFTVLIGPSTTVYSDWEYDYSQLKCNFTIKKVGEKSPLYKIEKEAFSTSFLLPSRLKIEKDDPYQIKISFTGEIKGGKTEEENLKRLPLNKVEMFVMGEYKSSQTLAIRNDNSESDKRVTIKFHREATEAKTPQEMVPIEVGIIKELLVQLE